MFFLPAFIILFTVLSTLNIQHVKAAVYPQISPPRVLVEADFSDRISWDANQAHYIVAWNTNTVHVGLIPKHEIENKGAISFLFQRELDFSPSYEDISSPSVMLLENGTILLLVKMRLEYLVYPGFYFLRSNDNDTTWSTPVVLTMLNEKQIRNNYLLRVNSTHIVSFWEENYGLNQYVNNSIVYRISPDFGITWSDKQVLYENCTRLFSATQNYDGRMLLSMIFEHEFQPGVKPYFPYFVGLSEVEETWHDTSPIFINNTPGTEIPFFTYEFDNNIMMVAYSKSVLATNLTIGITSDPFSILDNQNYDIVGLAAVNNETAVCFTKNGTQCLLFYLDVSFELLFTQPGLPPEVIMVIIILILVGTQVGIYMAYTYSKKHPKKGKRDMGEKPQKKTDESVKGREKKQEPSNDEMKNKNKETHKQSTKKGKRDI